MERKLEDYKVLVTHLAELLAPFAAGAGFAATTAFGQAAITLDDCVNMKFTCGGKDFIFAKAGKDSWVETVKYSHRHGTNITVSYDNTVTGSDGTSHVPTSIIG